MTKSKQEIGFSEPVREIMERPPVYLTRFGTIGVLIVFILFFILGWFIKYPDTIPGKIILTTENPPVDLIAKRSGMIRTLMVADGDSVKKGEILAYMESTSEKEEIEEFFLWINSYQPDSLSGLSRAPALNSLGELQEPYSIFRKIQSEYIQYILSDQYGIKAKSLLTEINGISRYLNNLESKRQMMYESATLEHRQYRRDSVLNRQGVLSDAAAEASRQKYLSLKIDLQQILLEAASKEIDISTRMSNYNDVLIMRQNESNRITTALHEAFSNLKAASAQWLKEYLIVSPVTGNVSFTRFWADNQFVAEGVSVMSVVPSIPGRIVGKLELKMNRSGKVADGQLVIIKLNSFPFMEYGAIPGVVGSKSLVPEGDKYIVEVNLPQGLLTMYNKPLEFSQNMEGMADIITEDYRLLSKIVDPLKYLWSRQRLKSE